MTARIENYAIIADCRSAALVAKDGSIDWLCLPRFDSGACFAALLGDAGNGRWKIAPAGPVKAAGRRYVGDTLVYVSGSRGISLVSWISGRYLLVLAIRDSFLRPKAMLRDALGIHP